MGFVFQAFHVLPYLSAAQNVALPLALLGVRGTEADARVTAMLDAVGMNTRGPSMPRELSGGELQRVAIARALIHRPALVLADEPTGNLDAESAASVIALLRGQLRAQGATGILVTHSQAAAATADRVLTLSLTGCARFRRPQHDEFGRSVPPEFARRWEVRSAATVDDCCCPYWRSRWESRWASRYSLSTRRRLANSRVALPRCRETRILKCADLVTVSMN